MGSFFSLTKKFCTVLGCFVRSVLEFLLGVPTEIWALSKVSLIAVPIPIISKPGRQQRRRDFGQNQGRSHRTFYGHPTQGAVGRLRLMMGRRSENT